jgi:DNA-binding transcriptional MerR regulator
MTQAPPRPTLTIGQVADRTGLSVHTLRFYEREGIFASPIVRDAGGRRHYGGEDLEWLEVVNRLRSSGMPLQAIRRYADLVRQGDGNELERLAILHRHRDYIIDRIRALTDCLDVITHKVGWYEAHLAGAASECV